MKFVVVVVVVLDDEGRKGPNTTISGLSSTHQRNAISMAFRWRADVGPTLSAGLVACVDFHGIRASNAKKSYTFVIFQGGGDPDPLSPTLDPHTRYQ